MTYRTLYSSVSSTPMQLDELEDILEQAQGNNAGNAITGALVYVDGFFLQVLEGEKDTVQKLMHKICGDFRHESVTVLQEGEVPAAAFSDWTMAYVSATPQEVARWAGLSGTTQLPKVWDDIHQNPQRAAQVVKSILAVLVSGPSSQGKAG
jgi:hypothetical protein